MNINAINEINEPNTTTRDLVACSHVVVTEGADARTRRGADGTGA